MRCTGEFKRFSFILAEILAMKAAVHGVFLFLSLFVLPVAYGGGKYFTWFDGQSKARVRLDVTTGQVLKEVAVGNWQSEDQIQLPPDLASFLPPTLSNHYFFGEDFNKIILTVDGTGQVYELDLGSKQLSRMDRTFYSGYNFGATLFKRNGIIYSVGGVGFWAYSQAITYFDEKSAEWQAVRPKTPGPESIFDGYQGYSESADKFFTGGSELGKFLENVPLDINKEVYAYDFKTNSWEMLGEINPLLFEDTNRELAWNGQFFIQFSREKVYLIDPVANKVFVYQSTKEQFQGGEFRFVSGNEVFCYWDLETGPVSNFSISEIQEKATFVGHFYSPKSAYTWYFVLAAASGIVLLAGLLLRKRFKKSNQLNFDAQEKVLIHAFLALPAGSFLSTVEVNELLGLSTKTLENQRKIRLNTIAKLNQKIQLYFKIEKAIERHVSPEDKRQSRYSLNAEANKGLSAYFQ